MCTSHDQEQGEAPQAGAGRRGFLRATALLGAAATAGVALPGVAEASPSTATAGWRPDADSRRFTLAVMPDTQYLFDGPSINPAPIEASLRYLLEHGRDDNIVFLSHLGDLTENGAKEEFAAIGKAFELLDRRGVGYSVLAGNHDVKSSTNDQRGATPYLDTFGPRRFQGKPTFGGASSDGYNTYHLFRAAGREWMVLALDWRLSPQGYAWAKDVLARHPKTPVILTTHELVVDDDALSSYGQQLWDQLIKDHDQIFLTLNGHYWPAGRAVRRNAAGNDVHLHLTNYQNRYFGGAAMIRLYHFDLDRDVIDVETVSPWILGRAAKGLNELERQEIELSGDADRFSVGIDFADRFSGFDPVPVRPARPASKMLIRGTAAYWRFDSPVSGTVRDLSGRGNDLTVVSVGGGTLGWSADHHPDQPGHGSLEFTGFKSPLKG
ncbi:twin-arginine translocation signal domain-containing protein, partial [Streptomyces chartreusis]|uniref:twin-arginine translocation signal domain-containing protein n=1 Tax=Streptomyces chartreusis TaxID=1969 RepID=UPI0036CC4C35